MGAWGTGLYDDDTTCEVRDNYVQHLQYGLSSEAASQQVLARFAHSLQHPETACLVYFALADTAWRYGRLHDALKDRALSLLSAGGDVVVWERDAPCEAASRRRALEALVRRLNAPQPMAKAVQVSPPKPKKMRTSAPMGSVFSLPVPGKGAALLVLVGFAELEDSIDPVFSILARPMLSAAALPDCIDAVDTTLVLSTSPGRRFEHVAILPKDERRSILTGLEPVDIAAAV